MKKIILLITSLFINNALNAKQIEKKPLLNSKLLKTLDQAKVLKNIKSEASSKTGGGGSIGPKTDK
jgi:hypothetical protein